MARVKATDLIDYTRASNGTALAKVSYGSELVTNGNFDTDVSGWTAEVGVDATVTSGEVQLLNTAAGTGRNFYQTVVTEVGKVYSVSYYCQKTPGGTTIVFAGDSAGSSTGGDQQTVLGDGDSSFVFVAGQASTYITCRIGGTDGQGAIFDNISVKEVTFDQPDGTLQLFNHPTNIPRIEYDADGNLLGLLIEESRTNLIPYSEDFSAGATTREDAGEFQGMSRKLFTKPTTSAVAYNHAFTASAGDYTLTLVMERGTNRYTSFGLLTGGWLGLARIDWDSMIIQTAAGTLQSSSVEILGTGPSGNPVARLTATINVPSAGTVQFYNYLFNSTTTVENLTVYFYHQQVEAGSFPTSYIPTSGATATRAADVASIPVSEFGYNQNQGTLFAEYKRFGDGNAWIAYLGESTNTYISLGNGNSGTAIRFQVTESGVQQASLDTATTVTGTPYKQAGAFKANDFASTENGNAVHTDTSGILPDGISFLDIGEQYGNYLNGHIKSIKYYPRRLTNATLQELTE